MKVKNLKSGQLFQYMCPKHKHYEYGYVTDHGDIVILPDAAHETPYVLTHGVTKCGDWDVELINSFVLTSVKE